MKIKTILLASAAVFCGAVLVCGTIACVSTGAVDAFNAGPVKELVDAVNADPGASEAVRTAAQHVADATAVMSESGHNMVKAAVKGDWMALFLQLGAAGLGLATTGAATARYVNKTRDASSQERTKAELDELQSHVVKIMDAHLEASKDKA